MSSRDHEAQAAITATGDEAWTAVRYPRAIWDDQPGAWVPGAGVAVLTGSPSGLIQAEDQHRDHAVIEQVLADLSDGPLAHLPSGKFTASAA